MTSVNPPDFPQTLLEALVRADAHEAVSGDLLEEYREARVPALGRRRANLWYWRQVTGIWLRAYWWFVVAAIVPLVVNDLFNTFRLPSGASYLDGMPGPLHDVVMSPLALVPIFALAGAYGSRRTGRWEGGFWAAVGTFVLVWVFVMCWSSATFYPFAQVQQKNPYWVGAWHWSTNRAHSHDTFLRWMFMDNVGALMIGGIFMLAASVVFGSIGSTLGLVSTRRSRQKA